MDENDTARLCFDLESSKEIELIQKMLNVQLLLVNQEEDLWVATLKVRFINSCSYIYIKQASFSPTKPFETIAHFYLSDQISGARWKIPLRLLSHPPAIDDTIIIEGSLQKISNVSFNLLNNLTSNLEFKAYFSKETPSDFTVYPTSGILKVDSDKGPDDNKFTIQFKPSTYGKSFNGTLYIEAGEMSWSFEVKGIPQKYRRPTLQSMSSSSGLKPNLDHQTDVKRKSFTKLTAITPSTPPKSLNDL